METESLYMLGLVIGGVVAGAGYWQREAVHTWLHSVLDKLFPPKD